MRDQLPDELVVLHGGARVGAGTNVHANDRARGTRGRAARARCKAAVVVVAGE